MSVDQAITALPWSVVLLACVTLGLAPFSPPHILEKVQMLYQGRLVRPIDWFDLVLHATPWLVLLAKIGVTLARGRTSG